MTFGPLTPWPDARIACVVYWSPLLPPCPPTGITTSTRQVRPSDHLGEMAPPATVELMTGVLPGVTPRPSAPGTAGVKDALTSANAENPQVRHVNET